MRILSGHYHHQGPTRHPLLSCADPAVANARFQRAGESGVWYASSLQRGAWAELFRHWQDDEVSPFELRRRVGRVTVTGLRVLDLTSAEVRAALGVELADLVGDDYTRCQQLAQAAYAAGLDGVLGPSGALPDCRTLAVFARALTGPALTSDHSRIQRPPATLLDVLHVIRPTGPNATAVGQLFRRLRGARPRRAGRRRL